MEGRSGTWNSRRACDGRLGIRQKLQIFHLNCVAVASEKRPLETGRGRQRRQGSITNNR